MVLLDWLKVCTVGLKFDIDTSFIDARWVRNIQNTLSIQTWPTFHKGVLLKLSLFPCVRLRYGIILQEDTSVWVTVQYLSTTVELHCLLSFVSQLLMWNKGSSIWFDWLLTLKIDLLWSLRTSVDWSVDDVTIQVVLLRSKERALGNTGIPLSRPATGTTT